MDFIEKIHQFDALANRYVGARPLLSRSLLVAFWSCVVSLLLFAGLVLTIRWVVLPQVGQHVEQIEQQISTALNAKVRIGRIEPSWEGFWPRLMLQKVRVSRLQGQEKASLTLPQVDASFYWRSLLGTPSFRTLRITQARLNIERISESVYEIGGLRVDINENERAKKPQSTSPLQFLVHQGRLDLIDAEVNYVDRRDRTHEVLYVRHLNASFSRSIRHWNFGLQADYLDKPIDLRLQLERPLFAPSADWRTWAGKLYAKIDSLDCAPAIKLLNLIGPVSRGRGSGEVWAEFRKGEITSLSTDLLLENVEGSFGKDLKPLRARQLATRLSSTLKGNTLKATIEHLAWVPPKGQTIGPFSGLVHVDFDPTLSTTLRGNVTLSNIDIESIGRTVADSFAIPEEIRTTCRTLKPRGHFSNIRVSWKGPYAKLNDWLIETDFSRVSIHSVARKGSVGQPGFDDLSGTLRVGPKKGSATLRGLKRVSLPGIFEFPDISLSALSATLDWKTPGGDAPITFGFKDVKVENPDLALNVSGQWVSEKDGPGTLQLKGKIHRLAASAAWRYMPLTISADTRLWLEGALRSGEARNATVLVQGNLKDFPWAGSKNKQEHFLIEGTIHDGLIDFMPEEKRPPRGRWNIGKTWPVVSGIQGTIKFEGALMEIRAKSASTHGLTSSFVSATIPDLTADITLLDIQAKAEGALSNMSSYLEASPVGAMLDNVFSGAKVTGRAKLDLALHVPLEKSDQTQVKGTIHFKDNTLELYRPIPPLSEVNGTLSFTQAGASTENLRAKALSSALDLKVSTASNGAIRIDVDGSIDPRRLVYFNETELLRTLLAPLSGKMAAQATITIDPKKGTTVTAQSDLTGVSSHYPVPYAKTAGESWPTTFAFRPITLRKKHGYLLSLHVGEQIDLILQLAGKAPAITPIGALGLGKQTALPRSGMLLDIQARQINFRDWENPVHDILAAQAKTSARTKGVVPELSQIKYNIQTLAIGDSQLHHLHGQSHFVSPGVMDFSLAGEEIEGKMLWNFNEGEYGHISAHLQRYHTAKSLENRIKAVAKTHPKKTPMPSLDLVIDDLAYGQSNLGKLSLRASTPKSAQGTDWKIETLTVTNPDATFSASGLWSALGTTSLNAKLDLVDVGGLLRRLDHPGIIAQGSGMIDASLTWKGAPWDPVEETMQGSSHIDIRRGVVEQADLGVGGAFLSLVSFQSLLRRLTLDFFDFAHTSYTFDVISGDIRIQNGVATSDNVKCVGAKASIMLSGSADLVSSTINAKALVMPNINVGGAALSLAFINPVVGLSAFVGQWLLSHPLSQMMSAEYAITGPLRNPVIAPTKTPKENPNSEALAP